MKTMVDNAKIARMEKDIKETDSKVKNIKSVPPSTTADAGKVLTVSEDGSISWQQKGAGGGMKAFFDAGGKCGGSTATSFDGVIPFTATSDVTEMTYMFKGCSKLTSVPLFDTSKVTNVYEMFGDCSRLTSVPLFNTSNVTRMTYMFGDCSSLTSVPLFNTSNVTAMNLMFNGCSSLTSIPLLDTSNVTDMQFMFGHCSSLTSIPSFDVSKATRMDYMFNDCPSLTSIPSFDVSKVTSMDYMFSDCSSLETIHMINIGADLDISSSTKFTREALLEIIGNLKTVTTTKRLTMGSTNLAKLTEEDKAIATNKGWSLV